MTSILSSYLESIGSPAGHFTALDGIFPLRDPQGNIPLRVLTHTVGFPVEWKGVNYTLKCFLSGGEAPKTRARLIAAQLGRLNAPWLPEYLYFENEMAVTSAAGVSALQDVVMQRLGPGEMLHEVLLGCCDRNDPAPVKTLLGHVIELSKFLSDNQLVHRNIKPANLFVRPDFTPVLLNWDFGEKCLSDQDNLPLARLALGLYLLACDPTLYRYLGRQSLLMSDSAAEMLPAGSAPEPLTTLAALIRQAEGMLEGREILNDCLSALAALKPAPEQLPASIRELKGELPAKPRHLAPPIGKRPAANGYLIVCRTAEGLTRVQREDGQWLYIDLDGRPQFDQVWDCATDFEEGRAVVGRDGAQMLIDRTGKSLIPMMCDNIEWDASSGTAQASLDGRVGLFNREGEQLTPLRYDWMSQFREELLLARVDDKYGFLDRRGAVVIPFIYESASSFSDGQAPAVIDGRPVNIDVEGKELQPAEGRSEVGDRRSGFCSGLDQR